MNKDFFGYCTGWLVSRVDQRQTAGVLPKKANTIRNTCLSGRTTCLLPLKLKSVRKLFSRKR